MKTTALYYSNIFLEHIVPNGHPENNNRVKFIIKKIKESNFKNINFQIAKPATHSILKFAHTESYLNWLSKLRPEKGIIKQVSFHARPNRHSIYFTFFFTLKRF